MERCSMKIANMDKWIEMFKIFSNPSEFLEIVDIAGNSW